MPGVVATCALDQWAMDFAGNLRRIVQSCEQCVRSGCRLRVGPELEASGYSCEDHFLESDTLAAAWDVVASVARASLDWDMIVETGAPAEHAGVRYNVRVFILRGRVLLVRPKVRAPSPSPPPPRKPLTQRASTDVPRQRRQLPRTALVLRVVG